ncbi:hypothetical protein BH09GEM1_BH09GEM1_12670 [soil metagenome]
MKWSNIGALSCVALLGFVPIGVQAQTVATIYGVYDNSGFSSLPSSVTGNPLSSGRYGNGGSEYDTPSLFFVNPTGYNIDFAQMVLSVSTLANSGQQTLNQGLTQTVSLGSLNANSITEINWNGRSRGETCFRTTTTMSTRVGTAPASQATREASPPTAR